MIFFHLQVCKLPRLKRGNKTLGGILGVNIRENEYIELTKGCLIIVTHFNQLVKKQRGGRGKADSTSFLHQPQTPLPARPWDGNQALVPTSAGVT